MGELVINQIELAYMLFTLNFPDFAVEDDKVQFNPKCSIIHLKIMLIMH